MLSKNHPLYDHKYCQSKLEEQFEIDGKQCMPE